MYDIVACYAMLVYPGQITKDKLNKMVLSFNKILDNGYVYQDIRNAIQQAHNNGTDIPWKRYNAVVSFISNDRNLLKSGTRYYHKNLIIRGSVPIVEHDIDKGTLVSRGTEFFVEPKASYTMNQLIDYFWDKTKVNQAQFNRQRVATFFQSLLRSYSIDNLLFIIEAAGRAYEDSRTTFTFRNFVDFNPIALGYMSDIKQSCAESGGSGYVYRKRLLPL